MFSFPPPPNLLYFFFCFQHLFVLGGPVRLLVAPFSFLRLFFFFFFSFPVGPRNEWMGTARGKKKGKKERRKRFLRSGLPPVRWMARKSSREAGQVGLFSLFFVVQFLSSSLFLSFFFFFIFYRRAIVKLPTLTEFFTCLIRRLLPERSTWLFFSWMLLYWNGRWFMAPTWVRREWPINDLLKQAWAGFLIHLNRTS